MIDSRIEKEIPDELKSEKIWTFTRTDFDEKTQKDLKIPMDPVALDLGIFNGISSYEHLITFEQLKLVRNVPDNWLPAFQLSSKKNQWAMVDVEPGGMENTNPYLNFEYTYVEASRHNGLHGLIKFPKDTSFINKTAVKIHNVDTEILLNHHFITLTGKKPQLYDPKYNNIADLISGIEANIKSQTTVDEKQVDVGLDDAEKPLSDNAQKLFNKLNIKKLTMPIGIDKSEWEFSTLVRQYHALFDNYNNDMLRLDSDEQIMLMYKAAKKALPYRKKHDRMFNNSSHGDRVNYLFHVVRKIVETNT